MRIANKNALAAASLIVAFGFASVSAHADPVPGTAPLAPPPSVAMPATSMLAPPGPGTLGAGATGDAAQAVSLSPPSTKDTTNKTISSLEDKASDSAKDMVKSLNDSDTMTLEDLNRARQTISKIDAMIEIEKRLGELDKARAARTGTSSAAQNLASAIPASALSPFPNKPIMPSMPSPMVGEAGPGAMPVAMHTPFNAGPSMDITRISGIDGKYAATVKLKDGTTRTVRVGDTVEGDTVKWVTSSAIGLESKGQTHVLHVKNVDLVYSATR